MIRKAVIILARIVCDFFSEALSLNTTMTVMLPESSYQQASGNKRRLHPTLYLLHGYSDDHSIWSRRTSIERYAAELGLAVIMPDVDHSFYADMTYGKKYWTFLTEELPEKARSFFPLSSRREENFVAGLSMGGYGAFKWALNKPEQFAAAASLSGVLDIAKHNLERKDNDHPMALTMYNAFGGQDIKDTEHDIFYLIEKLARSDQDKPMLYQACGTEDFLYQDNLDFSKLVDRLRFEVTTTFDSGSHEWSYWDHHIQHVLKWLPISKHNESNPSQ